LILSLHLTLIFILEQIFCDGQVSKSKQGVNRTPHFGLKPKYTKPVVTKPKNSTPSFPCSPPRLNDESGRDKQWVTDSSPV